MHEVRLLDHHEQELLHADHLEAGPEDAVRPAAYAGVVADSVERGRPGLVVEVVGTGPEICVEVRLRLEVCERMVVDVAAMQLVWAVADAPDVFPAALREPGASTRSTSAHGNVHVPEVDAQVAQQVLVSLESQAGAQPGGDLWLAVPVERHAVRLGVGEGGERSFP